MQRKSIPGFLINSVTPSETSTEFKKQMEEHMKLLTDSHPEIYKSVLSEKINYYLLAFWQKCLAL
jgi:hypothetical protein